MTTPLETVVRPFQTSDIGSPKIAAVAPPAEGTVRNVIINPGAKGQVKSFSGSYSITISYYFIKRPREKKKEPAA